MHTLEAQRPLRVMYIPDVAPLHCPRRHAPDPSDASSRTRGRHLERYQYLSNICGVKLTRLYLHSLTQNCNGDGHQDSRDA
jgi:hypothetical protein